MTASALTGRPGPAEYADRLARLAQEATRRGIDVVIVPPGADMTYFLGDHVASHERLTCLVVPAHGPASLVVPVLERPGWAHSTAEDIGVVIRAWSDGHDSYAVVAELIGDGARVLAVGDDAPARHVLQLQAAIPGSELLLAGEVIGALRMRKSPAEIAALRAVGAAIDRVQQRIGEWLHVGRTERQVAADIAAAIVVEGHARADFVIVASGPNGASPHHEASDRVIQPGDAVVIDIGGPAPNAYHSDCTRTYLVGGGAAEPADPHLRAVYDVVRRAQEAGVAAARPGATAESVDAATRQVIVDAGYGEFFITRTGHGIGLEVHEHPYIVAGNRTVLEPGMAFSVEPGIYLPGRFGVRIEDIVIVDESGAMRCNNAPTDLRVVN